MVRFNRQKMREAKLQTIRPVAIALLLFASSTKADIDGSEVTVILYCLLGWPAVIAAAALIAGRTRPLLVAICAAALYPLSAYFALLMASSATQSGTIGGPLHSLALQLLLAIWVVLLLLLKLWKHQRGQAETETCKQ
jgi:hypothetical protein